MSSGVPFGAGLRFLIDGAQRFARAGLVVSLRIRNTTATTPADEHGFERPAQPGELGGTSDIVITPPPDVFDISLHDIGQMEGKLFFGAQRFIISHTWVKARMAVMETDDPYQVFRGTAAVGLIYSGKLYSIESVTHKDAGGEIIKWVVIGNASETKVA